jgi:hypothetical protein
MRIPLDAFSSVAVVELKNLFPESTVVEAAGDNKIQNLVLKLHISSQRP